MERRFFLKAGAAIATTVAAELYLGIPKTHVAPALASSSVRVFFLPGVYDDPNNSWVEDRAAFLTSQGITFSKIALRTYFTPQGREACLNAIHQSVENAPEEQVDLAGYSASAGVVEMYLDALERNIYTLSNPDKIRRVCLINGRNLYNLDLTSCPPNLVGLYKQLENPDLIKGVVKEIRVAQGGQDALWFRDPRLAQVYGVEPIPFPEADHGGIVGSDANLIRVLGDGSQLAA
jgi:hypothetical protein